MGIYDRQYMSFGPRSQSGLGSLRAVSINTWIIVINVIVFGLCVALPAKTRVPVDVQVTFNADATAEQRQHSLVDPTPSERDANGLTVYRIVTPVPGTQPVQNRVIVKPIGTLVQQDMDPLTAYGHFSTFKAFMSYQVWRFITFQFLHANVMHIALNMMGLWFFGGFVEQYLGAKRYAAFYLVCGIFGAILYLFLNSVGAGILALVGHPVRIPGLLFDDIHTPLVGASAGIFGVLMAAAFIAPSALVDVFYVIPLRLKTAVYGFFLLALGNLFFGKSNVGGDAAHVGGAIAGFFFIRRTHLLRDFFDIFGDSRRSPVDAARAGSAPRSRRAGGMMGMLFGGPSRVPSQEEVDRILEKVRTRGLQSLSESERRTLRMATEARSRG